MHLQMLVAAQEGLMMLQKQGMTLLQGQVSL